MGEHIDGLKVIPGPTSEKPHGPSLYSHRRRFFRALCLVVLCSALAFVSLCLYLDRFGQLNQARPAQAIIVLGSGVSADHVPGDSLRARTLLAARLYHHGFAPKIICTGGLGDYTPTEAEAARTLAVQQGVNAGDVLVETQSTNTMENARNAAAMCRQQGWTNVIAVSDPYHLWRVQRDFSLYGINAYPCPALLCERNKRLPLRLQWTAREALAVTRDVTHTVSLRAVAGILSCVRSWRPF
ncbi:MAG TPA: YdcF family protein [Armatimonadota bacterium]|jgi:uncharacterized SAM-binding protein YcdF (DUF218 family)